MPFINIQIAKGRSVELKVRIAQRIADVVMDETGLPADAVWIVFQNVPSNQWFVGKSSVQDLDETVLASG